jgi:hypothetical protein
MDDARRVKRIRSEAINRCVALLRLPRCAVPIDIVTAGTNLGGRSCAITPHASRHTSP